MTEKTTAAQIEVLKAEADLLRAQAALHLANARLKDAQIVELMSQKQVVM